MIKDFCGQFCRIQRNCNIKIHNFNIKENKYLYSSFYIFLSNFYMSCNISKAIKISNLIKNNYPDLKANFHISVSLYYTLQDININRKELINNLVKYCAINIRTLKKMIKYVRIDSRLGENIC